MEGIEGILNKLGWPTILTIILFIFKTAIDTFNIKGIERKLLSDSEKVLASLAQLSLVSVIFTLLFYMYPVFRNTQENANNLLVLLLVRYTLIFIVFALVSLVIFPVINYFRIKVFYSVRDSSIDWEIVKKVDKEKMLLRHKKTLKLVSNDYLLEKKIISNIKKDEIEKYHYRFFNNWYNIILRVITNSGILYILFKVLNYLDPSEVKEIDMNIIILMMILILTLYIIFTSIILTFIIGRSNRKLLKKNYKYEEIAEIINKHKMFKLKKY